MRRSAIFLGGVLVLLFAAVTLWKGKTPVDPGGASGLSAEQKAKIRLFWEVYRRAGALKRQRAWERAASAFREALKIEPGHEDALYSLGNVLFELERYGEAVAAWRRLAEVNPLSVRAHAQLGAVYSCGAPGAPFDLEVAERAFQRALEINREESGPILKLGEVALLKGDRDQALAHFTTVLRSNTRSIEAHYLVGYLRWLEGDRNAARDALQEGVRLVRADLPAHERGGEGDTRKSGPMLAEGAGRKSFFTPYCTGLKAWTEAVSTGRMEAEYQGLDGALKGMGNRVGNGALE